MAVNLGKAVAYLELDTSRFSKGFASAKNDLKVFSDKSATADQKIKGLSSSLNTVGGILTKTVSVPLLGVGTIAVKTASDFEEGMSKVKAISGATGTQFKQLEDKAIQMGAKTKFSARESAEAFKYMAMAGWETKDMLDGIEGVMNLAAASGEDLAITSDIVTDALTAFGLQAKDSSRFADVLAQASAKSNTNVGLMGETFKYVAPVAGALGYSIEDTAVAIGLLANAGIKGSQAGTSLRQIMSRLAKPTKEVNAVMKKLGISITDSSGKMKPLNDVLLELRGSFSKLSEKQKAQYAATLAGQEGMSALLSIVNASEIDFKNLSFQINNSSGAADKMAKTMQDNLKGSLEQFKGALESTGIIFGKKLIPPIDNFIKKSTGVVEAFNEMSDSEQDNILNLGKIAVTVPIVTKATGMLFGTIGKGISHLNKFNSKVKALGFDIENYASGAMSANDFTNKWFGTVKTFGSGIATFLTSPVGLATVSVAGLVGGMALAVKQTNEYKEEVMKLSEEEKVLNDVINETSDRYTQLQENRQATIESVNKEAIATQTLWEKLQSVVDENGRVLKGKETYAKFISSELSKALGIEIEITDGQIKKYNELKKSIEKVIQTKKAQMVQESLGEQYTEALKEQTNATLQYNEKLLQVKSTKEKLRSADEKLKQVTKDYNDALKDGERGALNPYNQALNKAQAEVDGLNDKLVKEEKQLKKAEETMVGYNETISNYTELSTAIIEGNADKIEQALLKVQEGFKTAEVGTRESLEEQVETLETKYNEMKEALQNGAEGITQETVERMKELSEQANEELKTKLEQDKTVLMEKFRSVGIEAPQELINKLIEKEPLVRQETLDILNNMNNGVALKKPEIVSLFNSLGVDAPKSLSTQISKMKPDVQKQTIGLLVQLQNAEKSKRPEILAQLKSLGVNIDTSLAGGIESNVGEVKSKAGSVGAKGNKEFKSNFEKEKAKAKIDEKTNASEVGKKARGELSSWFDSPISAVISVTRKIKDIIDGSHASGLDYVPYDGYIAELHKGERVLTKQQNKSYNEGRTAQGGDTFIFNNVKPTPYEYARQMKKAKKELLHDF